MVVDKTIRQSLWVLLLAVASTAAVARAADAPSEAGRDQIRQMAQRMRALDAAAADAADAADDAAPDLNPDPDADPDPDSAGDFDESQRIGSMTVAPVTSADGDVERIETTGSPWVLNTITALGLVVGLILLLRAAMNKLAGGRAAGFGHAGGKAVEVLGRTAVAPRQHVTILRVGHRVLIVGDGGGAMNTLADISDPDEIAAILKALAAGSQNSISQSFHQMVTRFSDKHHERDSVNLEGGDFAEHDTDRARDEVSGLLSRLRTMSREVV